MVRKIGKTTFMNFFTCQLMANRPQQHSGRGKSDRASYNNGGHVYEKASGDWNNRHFDNGSRGRGDACYSQGAYPTGSQRHCRQPTSGVNNGNRFNDKPQRIDSKTPKDFKKFTPRGPAEGISIWMGTPLENLKRAPECFKQEEKSINNLVNSPGHIIISEILGCETSVRRDRTLVSQLEGAETAQSQSLVKSDGLINEASKCRDVAADYSVEDYVSMPHFVLYEKSKKGDPFGRWRKIKDALGFEIGNSYALEKVIHSYNRSESEFNVLHQYFEIMGAESGFVFFQETLPQIIDLALMLPQLIRQPLPLLKQRRNKKITLSQKQVACLLANAFLCTFPNQNYQKESKPHQKRGSVPEINFITLYSDPRISDRKIEKLKCIINYFERVTKNMPTGNVTYTRQFVQNESDFWVKSEKKLTTNLHVSTDGTIEIEGQGMLQADFANKFVGGGVLTNGLVQEEIRFVLCPEMILSRLFTEMLTNNEVLIMAGCERFSEYKGYSDTFQFERTHVDKTERDELGRMYTEVVAMDALVFRDSYETQFERYNLLRELSKAFCAFKGNESHTTLQAVCTGNWGCGAFGGDKHLKALIQIIAANAAGRDIYYLTFGDSQLCSDIGNMYRILKEQDLSINDILLMAQDYGKKLNNFSNTNESLFDYIEKQTVKVKVSVINEAQGAQNLHDIRNRQDSHQTRNGQDSNETRNRQDSCENRNRQDSRENRNRQDSRENRNRQDSHENRKRQDSRENKNRQDSHGNRNRQDSDKNKHRHDSHEDKHDFQRKEHNEFQEERYDLQGDRPDQQGNRTDQQGDRADHQGDTTDHQGDRTDHQGDRADHQGDRTDHQGDRTGHQGDRTDHQGERADHQGDRTDHQGDRTGHQGDGRDHQGDRTDHQGDRTGHQGDRTDHQGDRTDHQGDRADHQGDRTGHRGGGRDRKGDRKNHGSVKKSASTSQHSNKKQKKR